MRYGSQTKVNLAISRYGYRVAKEAIQTGLSWKGVTTYVYRLYKGDNVITWSDDLDGIEDYCSRYVADIYQLWD